MLLLILETLGPLRERPEDSYSIVEALEYTGACLIVTSMHAMSCRSITVPVTQSLGTGLVG